MNTTIDEYKRLIFVLQDAWVIVHGCKDEALQAECRDLMRSEVISRENNRRMVEVLKKIWPLVNNPITSASLQNRVYQALEGQVSQLPWDIKRQEEDAQRAGDLDLHHRG